jgi:tetrahydromethanopterin S-methyltransferase subunit E
MGFFIMQGNPPLKFGKYEAKQSVLNIWTLVFAVLVAAASWAIVTIPPLMEEQGGTVALFAGLLVVILRVVIEWLRDNSTKGLPQ